MSHRSLVSMPLALLVLAGLVAACGDDPTRPDFLAEFMEADALDRSARELPGLGDLVAAVSGADPEQRAGLVRARELWVSGMTADGDGYALRREAVAIAAPSLADALPAEHWTDVRVQLEGWLGTADRMLLHMDLPAVRQRLVHARAELDRADEATSVEARVYHTVLAVSELVETTPRYVAMTLVARAAVLVADAEERGAIQPGRTGHGSLERARRLADWAARALEEGEHMRAIQRAYYAIQLVEDR